MADNKEDNKLPRFYELLREAHETSEAADLFDVRSEIPESKAEWNRLKEAHSKAASELITYIRENPWVLPQILSLTR